MNKRIFIALTLCMLFVGFASANGAPTPIIRIGGGSENVTIPISTTNGANVGSIHINLTFDPEIAAVAGVRNGDMDEMECNIGDGYVQMIVWQNMSAGINGSFEIADVDFEPVYAGTCPLEITVITFKDATNSTTDMLYQIINGTYTAVDHTPSPNPTPCPTCPSSPNPTPCPTCTPSPSPTPPVCSMPTANISLVSHDGMTVVVNTNASIGAEESWVYSDPCIVWNDGPNDENVSNGNHSHTYSEEGIFTITLVAQNTCGRWATDSVYVNVSAPPSCPEVNASVTLVSKTDLVVAVDVQMSPGAGATWANYSPLIDWGDSIQDNPVPNGTNTHEYADGGTYTIGVFGVNSCGKNNHSTITVMVTSPVAPVVLHLSPGWNLMAVPVNDPTADTAAELALKIDGCKEIVKWDALNQTYDPYTRIVNDWTGTDFDITTSMGIFVNVKDATDVSFTSTNFSD